MKRVLLTGATGFIGRHCMTPLLEGGHQVHAISRRAPPDVPSDVHWHSADLMNSAQVSELMARVRPTHLLHMAWYAVPGKYWTALENLRWVQGSLELLQQFASHGGERVVMAGTCAEYDWRYGYCSEQITPLEPATLYGSCKHALRELLDSSAGKLNISAAWGRVFFLYGPHEHPQRLVPHVILGMLRNEPINCSHGNQIRDFLYAEDVGAAFVSLLESDFSGAVNIGSGQPVSVREVIFKISNRIGGKQLLNLGAIPVSEEPPLLVADTTRLKEKVGWTPKVDLDTGIERTIDWWKEELKSASL